jgi:PhzF family phenazine biosynthesis protein
MASSFVLFNCLKEEDNILIFQSKSGKLTVEQKDGMLWLDFPARPAVPVPRYKSIKDALGLADFEVYKSADLLVVLDSEETVRRMRPDLEMLKMVKKEAGMPDDSFGVIITAPGKTCDFVSRFFAPNAGIPEDPVTGRAHCVLIPYWSKRLGKGSMTAWQLSKRGGQLWCEDAGERVKIGGNAVLYMTGRIEL